MNQLSGPNTPWMKYAEPEPAPVNEADLDVMMIVRLIRRRKRLILGVTVLLSLLALPMIMQIKPVYQAEARFMIQPVLSIDPSQTENPLAPGDEMERLGAHSLAETVVADLGLAERPEFNSELVPDSAMTKFADSVKRFSQVAKRRAMTSRPTRMRRSCKPSIPSSLSGLRRAAS